MNNYNINKLIKMANLFLKMSSSYCNISLDSYSDDLLKHLNEIYKESFERFEESKELNLESLLEELYILNIKDQELFQALEEKDEDTIFDLLFNKYRQIIPLNLKNKLMNYCQKEDDIYNEDQVKEDYNKYFNETKENMDLICSFINDAISRIENYNGTNWIIFPSYDNLKEKDSLSADSATIVSESNKSVYFSISKDEKFELYDIIDDEEDIEGDNWQKDYYSLINEIKNPGSSSKGKVITLYTARPVRDRDFYANTNTLPNGIYLTNKISSAEGLSIDLSGTDDIRDVWKVKINTKYLLQTLEGYEKQYRVIADNSGAPISENMELIVLGK